MQLKSTFQVLSRIANSRYRERRGDACAVTWLTCEQQVQRDGRQVDPEDE